VTGPAPGIHRVPDAAPHGLADAPAHRIRGMATRPDHRGLGLGRRLVEAGLEMLTERHGCRPILWCNARTTAAGDYARLGFVQLGEEFDIPHIGPHVVMVGPPADPR